MVLTEAVGRQLIELAELEAALCADLTVLDVRWRLNGPPGHADYEHSHLPGALFLDLDRDLCGRPGVQGRHPLPDAESLQRVLRAAGVRQDRPVVVYDLGDGMAAARAWWTLRWAGHRQVRVLHGGFDAWQRFGGKVTAAVQQPIDGDFTVRPGQLPVLTAWDAAELATVGTLIDARAPERYRGETEPIDAVAGHIPGAINLPYARLVDGGGRYREDLAGVFGLPEATRVGAYCGSGVTAAHTVLALHLAGRTDAALYVGSWSEWITDAARPVAVSHAEAQTA